MGWLILYRKEAKSLEALDKYGRGFASSARLSNKWYEFDIGWFYIRLMEVFKLAKVKSVAPRLKVDSKKLTVDLDTMTAVLGNRLQALSNFAKQVMKPVMRKRQEYNRLKHLLIDYEVILWSLEIESGARFIYQGFRLN